MEEKKEFTYLELLKIVFTVIAVISLIIVVYNIGLHTNNQDIEVLAEFR
jgi:hypothetical protein